MSEAATKQNMTEGPGPRLRVERPKFIVVRDGEGVLWREGEVPEYGFVKRFLIGMGWMPAPEGNAFDNKESKAG